MVQARAGSLCFQARLEILERLVVITLPRVGARAQAEGHHASKGRHANFERRRSRKDGASQV